MVLLVCILLLTVSVTGAPTDILGEDCVKGMFEAEAVSWWVKYNSPPKLDNRDYVEKMATFAADFGEKEVGAKQVLVMGAQRTVIKQLE